MTRSHNARLAGFLFLLYIAAGVAGLVVSGRATGGEGIAARLETVARSSTLLGVDVLLNLVTTFCAIGLGITLWAITRDQGAELALLGLICRVAEGLLGASSVPNNLALLWLATAVGSGSADTGAAHLLGAYLLRGNVAFTATFFAVGSTAFSWLLLRGRLIPVPLARLGVVASVLLTVVLPLQLAGFVHAPITTWSWLPMLVFEVPLGIWLMAKGVREPSGG